MAPQYFFIIRLLILCITTVSVGLCASSDDYVCPSRVKNEDGRSELLGIRCTLGCCGTISEQRCCKEPERANEFSVWKYVYAFGVWLAMFLLVWLTGPCGFCILRLDRVCGRIYDRLREAALSWNHRKRKHKRDADDRIASITVPTETSVASSFRTSLHQERL